MAAQGQSKRKMKRHTKNAYTSEQYDGKLPSDPPALADVVWLGDSLEVLQGFPAPVQGDLGYSLYRVQLGQMPPDSKPMRTVGTGVYELRDQDERAWYRVFYLKKIANVVYVLHCFEKRTAQTERKDIEVARERLKRLSEQQRAKEKRQTARPPDKGKRS
jgi:phage-related protein